MKKYIVPFLVMVFLFAVVDDASAQRRKKKRRTTKEETEKSESRKRERNYDEEVYSPSFSEQLNHEIKMGNLGFGAGFNLALKANTGYKISKYFTTGLGAKLQYVFINNFGSANDFSYTDYGGFAFGRAKLGQSFYLQGEYHYGRFGGFSLRPPYSTSYPMAGIGYMQQGFSWSYGFELMFVFDEVVRDDIGLVEYWLNFSYNF